MVTITLEGQTYSISISFGTMMSTHLTSKRPIQRACLSIGFLLLGIGMMIPPQAFGALPPITDTWRSPLYSLTMEPPGIKTWAAFNSANARNLCVRVTNSGTQEMTVWLLQSQSVVGLFTVLPQHMSAMCTMANKIEFGCSGHSCESTWAVFDER